MALTGENRFIVQDAMQFAAARARGARHIVIRNIKDYECSPIGEISHRDALVGLRRIVLKLWGIVERRS